MEAATAPPQDAEAEAEAEREEDDQELTIEGDQQQMSLNVGGRKPTVSSLTLQGGEVKMSGQFEKGTRVRFIVEGVIDEVATRDHRDRKTGMVTAVKRSHKLTIEKIEKL